MTPFRELVFTPAGTCIRIFAIMLFLFEVYLCISVFAGKRKRLLELLGILNALAGFTLMFALLDGTYNDVYLNGRSSYPLLVNWLYCLPFFGIIGIELCLLFATALLWARNKKHESKSFSKSTIKEAVDLLPTAICFGNSAGTVVFNNLKMSEYCRRLMNKNLTDAEELWKHVCSKGEVNNEKALLVCEDGTALMFSRDEITVEGKPYTQITAADFTEQYQITDELKKKNAKLKDLQLRMKAFSVEHSNLIMSKEILTARTTVHDNVGHLLLRMKYYLEHTESTDENALYDMLISMNTLLVGEAEQPEDAGGNAFGDAVKMAGAIGVKLEIDGELPASESLGLILAQAVKECAANTVKHAEGNRVFLGIKTVDNICIAVFKNNGNAPNGEIKETGGLLSLNRAVTAAGGDMEIISAPRFELMLSLPLDC